MHRICCLFMAFCNMTPAAPSQTTTNLTAQEIFDRCGEPIDCALGEELELEIQLANGIHLFLEQNPHGLSEYAVFFAPDHQLWVCAKDTDGFFFSRFSVASYIKSDSALYQVGGTPCLAFIEWELLDDSALVGVCISDDPARNLEILDQGLREVPSRATLITNRRPFPPASISEQERLAGFCRLWSEVQYNFAFFDQVPQLDWNQVLHDTLPKIQEATDVESYYREIQRCLAQLQDGHTNAFGPGLKTGPCHPPFAFTIDANRRAVIRAVTSEFSIPSSERRKELKAAALRPGDVITHRNGQPFADYLQESIEPTICASTPQGRGLAAANRALAGEYHEPLRLTIEREGQPRDVTLTLSRYDLPRHGPPSWFEVRELSDGLLYINLPSFGDATITTQFLEVMDRVRESNGLIFDVRANGGGNSRHGYNIISQLIDEPIPGSVWRTCLIRPAYKAWGYEEEWHHGDHGLIQPASNPYLGPVAVLIGPATFSAAEDFVVALHSAERATVIGSPSGGSTGQPLMLELPGRGGARICTKRDTYPDGREFVGVGIQPDLPTFETVEDIANGRDAALELAIQHLKNR